MQPFLYILLHKMRSRLLSKYIKQNCSFSSGANKTVATDFNLLIILSKCSRLADNDNILNLWSAHNVSSFYFPSALFHTSQHLIYQYMSLGRNILFFPKHTISIYFLQCMHEKPVAIYIYSTCIQNTYETRWSVLFQ